jgi:thiamine biosynthesis lipoprotein
MLRLMKYEQMLPHSRQFDAIGTQWSIETKEELPDTIIAAIMNRIEKFDQTYSRFRPDSLVTKIAKQPGSYQFPDDAKPLIEFYQRLYTQTSGMVTPLIGTMLEQAGYDANYTFSTKPFDTLPQWDDVMKWQGNTLITTQPVTLDFGAAGKGYLVDIIAEILDSYLIDDYVIDASGDIRHKGVSENRVGLEHPFDPSKVIGVIDVRNKSMCASAINRRAWGDTMHHIFNPDSKEPVREIVATWVIAESTMIADGLATALFFVDPAHLNKYHNYHYVRVHSDNSIDYSHEFKGELF